MLNNPLFCGILLVTSALQCLIVQFGSVAFAVVDGGLDGKYWGLCLLLGAGALPVQQIINVLYAAGSNYKGYRIKKRLKKNRNLTTQPYDDGKASLDDHGHQK